MLSQMKPYRPTLYRPDSRGRFRLYPRETETPIPGAGYEVGQLVWAEQELDLDGGGPMMLYGSYEQVPLRGLGAEQQLSPETLSAMAKMTSPQLMYIAPDRPAPDVPPLPADDFDVSAAIDDAARQAAFTPPPAAAEEPGFLQQKVGPVPVWALGLGGLAVAGGATWYLMRRRKR